MNHNVSKIQNSFQASGLEWNSENGQLLEDANEPAVQARRAEAERMEELKANRFGEPTALEQAVSNDSNASHAATQLASVVKAARERCLKAVIVGPLSLLPRLEPVLEQAQRRLKERLQMEAHQRDYYSSSLAFVESPTAENGATEPTQQGQSLVAKVINALKRPLSLSAYEAALDYEGWTEAEIERRRELLGDGMTQVDAEAAILRQRQLDENSRLIKARVQAEESAQKDSTLQEAIRRSRADYVAPRDENASRKLVRAATYFAKG